MDQVAHDDPSTGSDSDSIGAEQKDIASNANLKDAIVIPQTAIITATSGTFVYVLGDGNAARQVPVKRVYAFGDHAVVTGLSGAEQVITEGKQNLRPGASVRLAQAAKPAVAPQPKQGEQA